MHTIMPGMATQGGNAAMAFGVMGGDYQPYGHTRILTNVLDYGMDPQAALDTPRVFAMGNRVEVERSLPSATVAGLIRRGHAVNVAAAPQGGGQIIRIDPESGVLAGGSDPRKDGCALGY
jgi:gamma-glutamyltranspeptidase/glutathione hydrolase